LVVLSGLGAGGWRLRAVRAVEDWSVEGRRSIWRVSFEVCGHIAEVGGVDPVVWGVLLQLSG
jgi:hypothetical protein